MPDKDKRFALTNALNARCLMRMDRSRDGLMAEQSLAERRGSVYARQSDILSHEWADILASAISVPKTGRIQRLNV
jgi:hypothetical protein